MRGVFALFLFLLNLNLCKRTVEAWLPRFPQGTIDYSSKTPEQGDALKRTLHDVGLVRKLPGAEQEKSTHSLAQQTRRSNPLQVIAKSCAISPCEDDSIDAPKSTNEFNPKSFATTSAATWTNASYSVSIEDVTAKCADYHNSKRVFRLTTPIGELTGDTQERGLQRIKDYVSSGCVSEDVIDFCSLQGVNIFESSNDVTCEAAIDTWYDQIHDYTYERYSQWHHHSTGSFTQLMWSESRTVGCYRTSGCKWKGKRERLLCAYFPLGNIIGKYPFSVEQWKSVIEKEQLAVTTILGPFISDGSQVSSTTTRPMTTSTSSTTSTPRPTTTTTTRKTTTTTSKQEAPTTTTTAAPAVKDFTSECLDEHNAKRITGMSVPIGALARHGGAQSQAENYRDKIEKTGCPFSHSQTTRFGENLYKSSFYATCGDAVSLWYKEKDRYTQYAPINSFNYKTFGHFTQVMWASTTGLGCAVSTKCKTIICNYYPPGNFTGRYPFSQAQYRSILARDG